ncbi:helix-turn-helix transcriptional regulator [Enterobacter kobei]|uniref:helix-turn-helix transcriptional regulator n=1 Tax=Enterobacter kobei TaxID=208224 RepID=UPI003CEE9009
MKTSVISVLKAALSALEATLPSNIEVVIHDFSQPDSSVVAIINGHVSGRQEGSELLSGPDKDISFLAFTRERSCEGTEIYKNYFTVTRDGRKLNSASAIYFDNNNEPLVGFCINSDVTQFDMLKNALSQIDPGGIEDVSQKNQVSDEMKNAVDRIIAECASEGENLRAKRTRIKIVSIIKSKGLFKIKGCVGYTADLLGVSRHTIYNDLKIN